VDIRVAVRALTLKSSKIQIQIQIPDDSRIPDFSFGYLNNEVLKMRRLLGRKRRKESLFSCEDIPLFLGINQYLTTKHGMFHSDFTIEILRW
jgi:hypothetical protein